MPSSSSILSELDWDEGIAIPVANAENKSLEDEIQKKQKKIVALQTKHGKNVERIGAIQDHMKNVKQELHHTQNLVNARKKEIDTTEHFQKVASREDGRIQQELIRLGRDFNELKERSNRYENNIFKQTQRVEELKSQMNWDEKALEAWLEESARKDEDAMTIIKYTQQDEGRIKELTLRIEHLSEEYKKKKEELDRETTNTHTTQVELDKTAEEFRRTHAERQELIQQWEHTIEQMQRRDHEMDLLAGHLAVVRNQVRENEETIKEKEQFLENEQNNNEEKDKQIQITERTAARLRLQYQEEELARDQFNSELEALKRTCDRTALDLELTRSQITQLKRDTIDKQQQLKDAKIVKENLVEKLKIAEETSMSAEERAQQMDKLLTEEERRQVQMKAELERLREQHFQKSEVLNKSKTTERNIDAEIQGSRATLRNLNAKLTKIDTESLKQQEILYNQDFTIQQLERRMGRMQGETSNEDKLRMEAKIKELVDVLKEEENTKAVLTQQLKRLQDDIRRVKRDLEKASLEKKALTSKIEELELHSDSSHRELKNVSNEKQELMVEHNVLKLELKKLRDTLNFKADDVLSLEKRRLQLETAMKERSKEISLHQDMLISQLRAAEDERQHVSSELHERIAKIDKLKKRYEILMVSMAPPEGEEEQSQAFYVIKAAQEKEELQRDGDDLDAKIRKAEKEIRALENTLRLMNSRNETYRKSFNKVQETSEEMEEKQALDEQQRAVTDKYKYKKRQIREMSEDLRTMSSTLDNLCTEEEQISDMMDDMQRKKQKFNKELEEQKVRLERVTKQNNRLKKELKLKKDAPEDKDIELRGAREFNKSVMNEIGEMVSQFPEMTDNIYTYFTQANLPPPSAPSSASSSARSSIASVRSSRASAVDVGQWATRLSGSSSSSAKSSARSSRR
ncbi:DgyrCDS7498 [Dimorphilus gyrociliatus]|uniref:Coiled-coil domain-containing protein 39 n=1 Tax=Dimorphilus gyrociliatus TaxID=2664684 RepID=A0A7I8VRB4_9ANNE|nr:DgyrCDS7498 [Dimorphilus gyrociliatus]